MLSASTCCATCTTPALKLQELAGLRIQIHKKQPCARNELVSFCLQLRRKAQTTAPALKRAPFAGSFHTQHFCRGPSVSRHRHTHSEFPKGLACVQPRNDCSGKRNNRIGPGPCEEVCRLLVALNAQSCAVFSFSFTARTLSFCQQVFLWSSLQAVPSGDSFKETIAEDQGLPAEINKQGSSAKTNKPPQDSRSPAWKRPVVDGHAAETLARNVLRARAVQNQSSK